MSAQPDTLADLDFAMHDLPTVRRRVPYGIGASEVALASLSLGLVALDTVPSWMRERAGMSRHGCARWIATKVGLAANPQKRHMAQGVAREPEILDRWIGRLERDEWQHECERAIDPDSVQWWGALPSEFPPFKDSRSPLVDKPDAWARTWAGDLVLISIKCARYGFSKPAWWNGITELPWYYADQQHAEHAIVRAKYSIALVGCGWNRDADDPRDDGPLLALPVWRVDREIERVRDVARRAWAIVEPRISRA